MREYGSRFEYLGAEELTRGVELPPASGNIALAPGAGLLFRLQEHRYHGDEDIEQSSGRREKKKIRPGRG